MMKTVEIKFIFLIILTVVLFFMNLFFGAVHIPVDTVFAVLTGNYTDNEAIKFIILESRLPQAFTALLAGAALAVSGLMLQTLFRNPLAGPSILGITSGASLGVALVVLMSGGVISLGIESISGEIAVTLGAFAGSFFIMSLLILLAKRLRNSLSLLIVGIMAGYLTSSVVSLLSAVSASENLQSFVMWGMGNFSSVSLKILPWFSLICIIGMLLSVLLVKPLNLLLLGDNYAINLGVNIIKTRYLLLVSTGLLTAIVTAFCGPIGFIGLAMPHIARLLFMTDDHRILVPATILSGSILALLCNILSVLPDGQVIPLNALTPIAGVPVVFYVILRIRK